MKLAPLSPPYANTREAYKHLLEYDATPTLPKIAPNAPVTLFVRNNFINYRAYESFEAISRYMSSCVFHSNVLVNVEHFKERYRELQAAKMYRMITGKRYEPSEEKDTHKVVWLLFQASPMTKMKIAKNGRQGNAYLFDLTKLAENAISFPKQCKVIISAIIDAKLSAYTLYELRIFANNLHKYGLKTKQDPFKILQYYLPQLHDAGLLEYPRKQYEKDEDTENENQ